MNATETLALLELVCDKVLLLRDGWIKHVVKTRRGKRIIYDSPDGEIIQIATNTIG